MIEVTVAIAAASRAVSLIKKGIQVGKDTSELSTQFAQFFDAKDKIDTAKTESENAPIGKKVFAAQSVEAYALEVALAEHKAKDLEKQLRELFVYSGQGDVYKTMMRARKTERQRRLEITKKLAARKKFIFDTCLIATIIATGMGIIASLLYYIF